MHDYYAILGVGKDASFDEIKRAFRRRAMECHPDRGGSHGQMVELNTAFLVLSDPEKRAAYDLAFESEASEPTQAWSRTESKVRAEAEQYAESWEAFERWWGHLGADIRRARYGRQSVFFIFSAPTGGNSWSAGLCIVAGALIVGYGMTATSLHASIEEQLLTDWFDGEHNIISFMLLYVSLYLGGAWLGMWFHSAVREALVAADAEETQASEPHKRKAADHSPTSRGGASTSSSKTRIVACPACQQRVRIPRIDSTISPTCPTCGVVWDVPADGGSASDGWADPDPDSNHPGTGEDDSRADDGSASGHTSTQEWTDSFEVFVFWAFLFAGFVGGAYLVVDSGWLGGLAPTFVFLAKCVLVGVAVCHGLVARSRTALVVAAVLTLVFLGSHFWSSRVIDRPDLPDSATAREIAEEFRDRVVWIETRYQAEEVGIFSRSKVDAGSQGSGVVIAHWTGAGLILTNKHVIAPQLMGENRSIDNLTWRVKFASDSSWHQAVPFAVHRDRDLALVAVVYDFGRSGAVTFAQIDEVQQGEDLVVLGSPAGVEYTVTEGIISKLDGPYVWTQAPMNPGNSGGPMLLKRKGLLVGIATAAFGRDSGVQNMSVGEIAPFDLNDPGGSASATQRLRSRHWQVIDHDGADGIIADLLDLVETE